MTVKKTGRRLSLGELQRRLEGLLSNLAKRLERGRWGARRKASWRRGSSTDGAETPPGQERERSHAPLIQVQLLRPKRYNMLDPEPR